MRIAKSAVIGWAVGASVAAVIGLCSPAWAESTTKRPPTQPTTQQLEKAGQPKGGARDLEGNAAGVKGGTKATTTPKAGAPK